MADAVSLSSDVMQTDLSVQVLDKIFGAGWNNIAALAGGTAANGAAMDTLIFDLLYVLNSCCAIVVAWMFILTTLCASLGAAQDGSGVGGRRYSNAWIPLRYTFAMGAITPVFHGMNAMQIMVLACLGVSINFADHMWETGLKYITKTGAVTSVSKPTVYQTAGRIVPILFEHAVMRRYLEKNEGCTFAEQPRNKKSGPSGTQFIVEFELPYPRQCNNAVSEATVPATAPGDFGLVNVASPTSAGAQTIAGFIQGQLYNEVLGIVDKIGLKAANRDVSRMALQKLGQEYSQTVGEALSKNDEADARRQKSLQDFQEYAAKEGWFIAGSYYWTLAKISADTIAAQTDGTTGKHLDGLALKQFDDPDLLAAYKTALELASHAESISGGTSQAVNPVKNPDGAKSGSVTPDVDTQAGASALAAGMHNAFGGLGTGLAELAPVGSVVSGATELVGDNDIVFNVVKLARRSMNIAEDVFITYTVTMGASSLISSFTEAIPIIGSGVKALKKVVEIVANFVLAVAIPFWAICWFYAYVLPMLPFIAWFTAVLGWVVLTMEAVIACPVWLIGHCMPEGDGFAGSSARAGYALFMSVLLRPLLLVISYFVCMIIMSVSGSLVGRLLMPFFESEGGAFKVTGTLQGWGITSTITSIILIGIIVSIATWKLFTLVTTMPDRIIRWAGQLIANLGDDGARETMQNVRSQLGGTSQSLGRSAKLASAAAVGATLLTQAEDDGGNGGGGFRGGPRGGGRNTGAMDSGEQALASKTTPHTVNAGLGASYVMPQSQGNSRAHGASASEAVSAKAKATSATTSNAAPAPTRPAEESSEGTQDASSSGTKPIATGDELAQGSR